MSGGQFCVYVNNHLCFNIIYFDLTIFCLRTFWTLESSNTCPTHCVRVVCVRTYIMYICIRALMSFTSFSNLFLDEDYKFLS